LLIYEANVCLMKERKVRVAVRQCGPTKRPPYAHRLIIPEQAGLVVWRILAGHLVDDLRMLLKRTETMRKTGGDVERL